MITKSFYSLGFALFSLPAIVMADPVDDIKSAIWANNADQVREILNEDPYLTDEDERELVKVSVRHADDDLSVLRVFAEFKFELDADDDMGVTPLMVAVIRNKPAVVEFLLEKGADANAEMAWIGATPLHLSLLAHVYPLITEMLLKNGADVNARDDNRWVSFISRFTADLDAKQSVFERLKEYQRIGNQIVWMMEGKNRYAQAQFDFLKARARTKTGGENLPRFDWQSIKQFVQDAYNALILDSGTTPLHWAVECANMFSYLTAAETVTLVAQQEAYSDCRDKCNAYPCFKRCTKKIDGAAKLADDEFAQQVNESYAHIKSDVHAKVRLLVAHGADPLAADSKGVTPISMSRDVEIRDLLKTH